MFHTFTQMVADASGWAYLIVFLLAVLDAVVPLVPSETAVITAGVVAANGDLSLALIIPAAAAGAFIGDNLAYLIGRRFGGRATKRFSGEKGQRRMKWAEDQLEERGGELIVVARFIPGGRTAVTLSAGTLGYPWRRFAAFDAAAALGWALYASLLGYYGGKTFESFWGLVLALLTAFAIAGGIEFVRWVLKRRRSLEPAAQCEHSGDVLPGLAEEAVPPDGARPLSVGRQREPNVSTELAEQLVEKGDADLHVAADRVRDPVTDEDHLRVAPRRRRHLHHAARAGRRNESVVEA